MLRRPPVGYASGMTTNPYMESALEWARWGVGVFPCAPGSKTPLTKSGFYDATTDEEAIRSWWSANPKANIGVVPGSAGFCAVDVDGAAGRDSIAAYNRAHGVPGSHLIVQSPGRGGGYHLWYKLPDPDAYVPSQYLTSDKGLQVRAHGGYVMVPPSVHPDGPAYIYREGSAEAVHKPELSTFPAECLRSDSEVGKRRSMSEVRELLKSAPQKPNAYARSQAVMYADMLRDPAWTPEGQRHAAMLEYTYQIASGLVAGYHTIADAQDLRDAYIEACAPWNVYADFDSALYGALCKLERSPESVAGKFRLLWASDTVMRRAEWLWEERLPLGDFSLLAGREGIGKAVHTESPVLTGRGWLTLADAQPGDKVRHPAGGWTGVVAVSDVMTDRPCYRLVFSDGAELTADADHEWLTMDYTARQPGPRNRQLTARITSDLAASVYARGGHCLNHAIPGTQPLDGPDVPLLLPPYVLGVWLGDGTSSEPVVEIARQDAFIAAKIRALGVPCVQRDTTPAKGSSRWSLAGDGARVRTALRALGVLGNKHIPERYLLDTSASQRWELLRGIMDTDGYLAGSNAEITLTSRALTDGVAALVRSLGIITSGVREYRATIGGVDIGPRYRVAFSTRVCPFSLPRKVSRWQPYITERPGYRYLKSVVRVPSVPVKCIQVAAPDGMWLAGTHLVPTHNSTITHWIAAQVTRGTLSGALRGKPRSVLYVSTEDSWESKTVPCLKAAGADLAKVAHVEMAGRNWITDVALPGDLSEMSVLATETGAALIVFDPLSSRIDRKLDTHKDADVKTALEPLLGFAHETKVAVLGLAHVNKTKDSDLATSVMGSRAFVASPRAVLFAARLPDTGGYGLSVVKSNYGPANESTELYTLDKVAVQGDITGMRVLWGSAPELESLSTLVQGAKAGTSSGIRDWLESFLSGGPQNGRDVQEAAAAAGYNHQSVKNAASAMRLTGRGHGVWSLP